MANKYTSYANNSPRDVFTDKHFIFDETDTTTASYIPLSNVGGFDSYSSSVSSRFDNLSIETASYVALSNIDGFDSYSSSVSLSLSEISGSDISNDSNVVGITVSDALNTVSSSLSAVSGNFEQITSDDILNSSSVIGTTVSDSLTFLSESISNISGSFTSDSIPVGSLVMWPTSTPPSGWLERNGSAISRTTYAALFSVIGTSYGVGDGSTTFNLPDDRGEFIRGWDNGRGVDSGRTIGSHQTDEYRSHNHGLGNATLYAIASGGANASLVGGGTGGTFTGVPSMNDVNPSGGSETRPRNRAYMPIIKY